MAANCIDVLLRSRLRTCFSVPVSTCLTEWVQWYRWLGSDGGVLHGNLQALHVYGIIFTLLEANFTLLHLVTLITLWISQGLKQKSRLMGQYKQAIVACLSPFSFDSL